MLGECDGVTRIDSFASNSLAVYLRAIAAIEVFSKPISPINEKLTVVRRDIREAKYNIATFSPPNHQAILEEWYQIATTQGSQLTKRLSCFRHCCASLVVISSYD
jgi:hypothetical protein